MKLHLMWNKKDGIFAVQIFANTLQIYASFYVCSENCT